VTHEITGKTMSLPPSCCYSCCLTTAPSIHRHRHSRPSLPFRALIIFLYLTDKEANEGQICLSLFLFLQSIRTAPQNERRDLNDQLRTTDCGQSKQLSVCL
jgi:hypothetical protein